jgi:hypothetical protein
VTFSAPAGAVPAPQREGARYSRTVSTAGDSEKKHNPLVCQECGEEADVQAHGWRAYLTDENEPVFYCPACSDREFGEDA